MFSRTSTSVVTTAVHLNIPGGSYLEMAAVRRLRHAYVCSPLKASIMGLLNKVTSLYKLDL